MISKYLVFHDDGELSSYEPQTKDEILTNKSDIWTFGCVLFYICTGL